jgi:hypothetical protein
MTNRVIQVDVKVDVEAVLKWIVFAYLLLA